MQPSLPFERLNPEPGTPNPEPRTPNAEPRTPNPEPRIPVVKPLREVLDAEAFVPPDVIALARWTAEYYAAGVGDTIPALLPPMARGGRADAHKTTRVAAITAAGLQILDGARGFQPSGVGVDDRSPESLAVRRSLTDKQRDALELLA